MPRTPPMPLVYRPYTLPHYGPVVDYRPRIYCGDTGVSVSKLFVPTPLPNDTQPSLDTSKKPAFHSVC